MSIFIYCKKIKLTRVIFYIFFFAKKCKTDKYKNIIYRLNFKLSVIKIERLLMNIIVLFNIIFSEKWLVEV